MVFRCARSEQRIHAGVGRRGRITITPRAPAHKHSLRHNGVSRPDAQGPAPQSLLGRHGRSGLCHAVYGALDD